MRNTWTRRLLYSLRSMRREASLTRTHFRHARKPLPGWVGDVELRVPLAIEYLIERLERKR